MRRPCIVVALAVLLVVVVATPASAHVVVGSIFARRPTCTPTCDQATTVSFRATVRLDACNVDPCSIVVRASVTAQVWRGGEWHEIGSRSEEDRLRVGRRINVPMRIPCGSGTIRFRTKARGGAVGPHTWYSDTPNPAYSHPIRVRCT